MTVSRLTRVLTVIDRQMPVHAVIHNDAVPPGTVVILANWADIAAQYFDRIRLTTARTLFELDALAHTITTKTLFDNETP
jgi:hypothetical protein